MAAVLVDEAGCYVTDEGPAQTAMVQAGIAYMAQQVQINY